MHDFPYTRPISHVSSSHTLLSELEFRITFTLSNEISIHLCLNYEANANSLAFRFWYQRRQ